MSTKTFVRLGAVAFLLSSTAAFAHHSNAMYDREKTLEIKGTVKEFQWTNPHVFIEIETVGANGAQSVYTVESSAPGILKSHGWKFNSIAPGDKVEVKVHPLRDKGNGGGLISLKKNGVLVGDAAADAVPGAAKQ
jgi:hypothetical protein